MANDLADLFAVLETVGQVDLRDPEIQSCDNYASLLSVLTRKVFHACADHLPPYVLGRALIIDPKDAGTLAYYPESPFIAPPNGEIDRRALAAVLAYIRLSRQLRDANRGGAITRTLLKGAKPPQRLVLLSKTNANGAPRRIGTIKYEVLPEHPVAALESAFQEMWDALNAGVGGLDEKDLPVAEEALKRRGDVPVLEVTWPSEPPDLSYHLVRAWFTCSGLRCYWLCGNPFPGQYEGGLYFLGTDLPTPEGMILSGLLTREIFLRAHLIEQLQSAALAREQARRMALLEKSTIEVRNLLGVLQNAGRVAQKLRRLLDLPPAEAVLRYARVCDRDLIPDGEVKCYRRWNFRHRWEDSDVRVAREDVSAQVSCVLLAYIGHALPESITDAWEGTEPWNRLRHLGELTIVAKLLGYEDVELADVLNPEDNRLQPDEVVRLFKFLRLCFHSPHKRDGKLSGPLVALWAAEAEANVESCCAIVNGTLQQVLAVSADVLALLEGLRQAFSTEADRCIPTLAISEQALSVGFGPLDGAGITQLQALKTAETRAGALGDIEGNVIGLNMRRIAWALEDDLLWVRLPK